MSRSSGHPPENTAEAGDWYAVSVPADADPAVCERCGRPTEDDTALALHRGLRHDDLDADERDAFRAAYAAEGEELRLFRLRTIAALVVVYFGFLFAYSVFT
ncbi:DNA-binding protein [Halobacteriales archaeon SW_7_68_16]|nr:MAG: DNA-binding protein [Halobacteriales archaeon SW_7_68_16]